MPQFLNKPKSTDFPEKSGSVREHLGRLHRGRSFRLSKRAGRNGDTFRRLKDFFESSKSDSLAKNRSTNNPSTATQWAGHRRHTDFQSDQEYNDNEEDHLFASDDSGNESSPPLTLSYEIKSRQPARALVRVTEELHPHIPETALEQPHETPFLPESSPRHFGVPLRKSLSDTIPQILINISSLEDIRSHGRRSPIPPSRSSSLRGSHHVLRREERLESSDYNALAIPFARTSPRSLPDKCHDVEIISTSTSQESLYFRHKEPRDRTRPPPELNIGVAEPDIHIYEDTICGFPLRLIKQTSSRPSDPSKDWSDDTPSQYHSIESSSDSDLPTTPHYVMHIPAGKAWRNGHRNYFPPGAAEMPQDMVVRICNRFRAEHEDDFHGKWKRYL